jgi:hypothetical protein
VLFSSSGVLESPVAVSGELCADAATRALKVGPAGGGAPVKYLRIFRERASTLALNARGCLQQARQAHGNNRMKPPSGKTAMGAFRVRV